MIIKTQNLILISAIFKCLNSCLMASVMVYPVPQEVPTNNSYSVRVRPLDGEWKDVEVYNVEVRTCWEKKTTSSMCYFDCDEPVEIEVTANHSMIESLDIRPKRLNIEYEQLNDTTVRFVMEQPRKISFEINDDIYDNLQIFGRYLEANPIYSSNDDVLYFGPGYHLLKKGLILDNGQTLYIAGGAFVEIDLKDDPSAESHIYARGKKDITISGRGVIYMPGPSFGDVRDSQGIRLLSCSNVRLGGVILLKQSRGWTVNAHECTHVRIADLGIISVSRNGDGIDIVGSQDVIVKDCFVRAADDALCVKSWNGDPAMENVVFQDSVAWNDVTSHPLTIGFELRSPYVKNITYRNIDVIHSNNTLDTDFGTIDITLVDQGRLSDVLFENIYIEEIHRSGINMFELNIKYHPIWSHRKGAPYRGSARKEH